MNLIKALFIIRGVQIFLALIIIVGIFMAVFTGVR